MTCIRHDFENKLLNLTICIIDDRNINLWNEVLDIMDCTNRQKEEIKQVYAIFNKNTDLQDKNKKILYKNKLKVLYNNPFFQNNLYIDKITEIEKMMYFLVETEDFSSSNYLKLELPIMRDEYDNNYLVIETTDDKYIAARYGEVDVDSYTSLMGGCFYGYEDQHDFCNFSMLPSEFRIPIEDLKKKIKIIEDSSTIVKVKSDIFGNDHIYKDTINISEPEPYDLFLLGKIKKLEKDLNKIKKKMNKNAWNEKSCNENKFTYTTDSLNEVSLTTTEIKLRQFSGIIGLEKEVYDYNSNNRVWTYEDVKNLIGKWINQRYIDNKTNLYILLSNVERLIYCYEGNIIEEQSIRVYGEIVKPNADIPDEEIKKILIDLFTYLKVELNQYSVRFNFQGYDKNMSIIIC